MREAAEQRRRARARFGREQIDRRRLRDAMSEASRLMRDARKQLDGVQERLLSRTMVICATAAGADTRSLGGLRFDRVVLDEATQAPDPMALVALSRAPKATLAGDPKQLPPTVIDPDAEREGLGTTFFERLAANASAGELVTVLDVQHRMHEALMRFPSDTLYGGALVAHPSVASHMLEDLGVAADPLRPGPLVFIDSAGKGWVEEKREDDPSTENSGQAERVAKEARRLIGRGLSLAQLAIITPYHAQVLRLRDLLAPEVRAGLEVGSVDGFQGREKEAVIVDLVRSNDAAEIGFLADVRRMNVAITRARRLLIVIGDSATIGSHPFYRAFLDRAEALGGWISAWSDEAEPFV
jgi:predicted DNA helicase